MGRIVVVSRSFARNKVLRAELTARYPDATFTSSPSVVAGSELINLLHGNQSAIVGLEKIDDAVLTQVPELRVISKYGVGLDGLDLDAIAARGIKLAWTGGVNKRSVSELTVAFAIALLHRLPESSATLRAGTWQPLVGRQLTGRTVGIVGCGFVGQDLVRLLAPFECRIFVNDIRAYPEFYAAHRVEPVSLDRLLAEAEIVTLHVPLDASTRGMIGWAEMARMRKGAVLINAARGGLVDEAGLADALTNGHLAGAAFDVFQMEPEANAHLLALPTFLATPHIGGSTEEAQLAMGRAAIDGLENARLIGNGWPV